jgi:hypothetical protein
MVKRTCFDEERTKKQQLEARRVAPVLGMLFFYRVRRHGLAIYRESSGAPAGSQTSHRGKPPRQRGASKGKPVPRPVSAFSKQLEWELCCRASPDYAQPPQETQNARRGTRRHCAKPKRRGSPQRCGDQNGAAGRKCYLFSSNIALDSPGTVECRALSGVVWTEGQARSENAADFVIRRKRGR